MASTLRTTATAATTTSSAPVSISQSKKAVVSGASSTVSASSSTSSGFAPVFTRASSSKRARAEGIPSIEDAFHEPDSKQPKLGEFSTSPSKQTPSSNEKLRFSWLPSNRESLLHGLYGPPNYSPKLACFDIDGTLIETKSGATFPKDEKDWKFWCPKGKVQLRLQEYHDAGYAIILISNQKYPVHYKAHINFVKKMPLFAKALGNIPFRILAATCDDKHRKPSIGMWTVLEKAYGKEGVVLDKASSFYVGDAAGERLGKPWKPRMNYKGKPDVRDSDLKWAENVGIPFYLPEEFFWEKKDLIDHPLAVAASTLNPGAVPFHPASSTQAAPSV